MKIRLHRNPEPPRLCARRLGRRTLLIWAGPAFIVIDR